jgi:protoheme IX farnesyltransferase
LTAIGGFFLAAQGSIHFGTLFALLVGMVGVIGAACVFNNYYDRDIDRRMVRTSKRATVQGTIRTPALMTYGLAMLLSGTAVLLAWTNLLTVSLGLLGFVSYVVWYTPAKHRTKYATLIGTVPGAIPPVAGYTAAVDHLDLACALLFVILVCWQMPHFYAIAIHRLDEYKAARVPVWPATNGVESTRQQMIFFMAAFVASCAALTVFGYSGYVFLVAMVLAGGYWAYVCITGWPTSNTTTWAKKVFLLSLPIFPLFCLLLVSDHWLV